MVLPRFTSNTFELVDFSVTVILYGLTAIICTTATLGGVYWHVSRRTAVAHKAAPQQQAHRIWIDEIAARRRPITEALETTGRHHIPDELLHVATYKLSADRLARAKVPDQ
jgi:hypothetical protein